MNDRQEARLEVMRGDPPDGDWRATTAIHKDAKEPYSYRFDGGKKGRGHLNAQVGDGKQLYSVKLKQTDRSQSKSKYDIHSVTFSGDDNAQLKWVKKDSSDNHATISNENEYAMQAYYLVVVQRDDGFLIDCDPMISNDPRHV
ncbi:hypothetical protein AB4059_07370 [Lysobacter sp. 2RAF19]